MPATQQAQTELQQLVAGLLPEWETTNVEFKRQLDLATKAQKAEFVCDILALATTKSSGERFLVIGFDNATQQFARSVDSAITQNRLEHILNAYAAPAPKIRYHRVAWDHGEIGVVQAGRWRASRRPEAGRRRRPGTARARRDRDAATPRRGSGGRGAGGRSASSARCLACA